MCLMVVICMKSANIIASVVASTLSLIFSIVQGIQIATNFIFSFFFLYMGVISLLIAVYSIRALTGKGFYSRVIFWNLIILFALGVVISIFSVGIFYLPILIVLILMGILQKGV